LEERYKNWNGRIRLTTKNGDTNEFLGKRIWRKGPEEGAHQNPETISGEKARPPRPPPKPKQPCGGKKN